jgi:hypothetical protein
VEQPSGTEQPETLAVMDWIRTGRFTASASLHEVAPRCPTLTLSCPGSAGLRSAPEADPCARTLGQRRAPQRAVPRRDRGCACHCDLLQPRNPVQGAVVANYPWDGSEDRGRHYAACPDDAAYVHLAGAYARAHASMAASAEFPGGITNGAAWYPLWGGMQARPARGLALYQRAGAGRARGVAMTLDEVLAPSMASMRGSCVVTQASAQEHRSSPGAWA